MFEFIFINSIFYYYIIRAIANLAVEAELISIIWEFLNKFSESLQKNCLIRLNHVSLVSAILCQHNIETKRHVQMCNILNKSKVSSFFRIHYVAEEVFVSGYRLMFYFIDSFKPTWHVF